MKREYISPEIEVQKFTFENILAAGGYTDDNGLIINDSNAEGKGLASDYYDGVLGQE